MRISKHLRTIILTLLFIAVTSLNGYALLGTWDGKLHIVYHLSDADKVNFVLGNIRNHLKGGGGEEKLDIILVIHGPALEEFDSMNISDKVAKGVADIQGQGVTFVACQNTMNNNQIEIDELIGEFQIAKEGGVTRIAHLQSLGYLYIRP